MKSIVELLMSAGLVALWGLAVVATVEATGRTPAPVVATATALQPVLADASAKR